MNKAASCTLPGGHIPVVASGEDHLRVALLQKKKLIFANLQTLAGLHGSTGARGSQVLPSAISEDNLPGPELQSVSRGLVGLLGQASIVLQEAVVGGL